MSSDADPYPVECPFCKIAEAFPATVNSGPMPSRAPLDCVAVEADATRIDPNCHLVISSPNVMAFLDIMPMAPGHLLVATRRHRVKISDVPSDEASDIGESLAPIYWSLTQE
jgi:diadenosine tetraphosphate (Ap4A) HIT family hydrolase